MKKEPKNPLYLQIAGHLRKEIQSGRFKVGERLGTQKSFCKRFDVSPITIEWALRALEDERLISRTRGRGTFVAARSGSPKKQREWRIGVVGHLNTNWETNIYARDLYQAIQLESRGNPVYIRFFEREADYAQLLDNNEVDGLLIIAPLRQNIPQLKQLDPKRHHFIVIGADWDITPCICVDNQSIVRQALEHLEQLGHQRIAIMTHTLDAADAHHRWEAYWNFFGDRGWKIHPHWVMHLDYTSVDTPEDRARLFVRLFNISDPPTAVLALGQHYANDLIQTLRQHELNVPGDVSVIGCDPPIREPALAKRLTYIEQPVHTLGREALKLLLASLSGKDISPKTILPAQFVVKSTTGPAPEA